MGLIKIALSFCDGNKGEFGDLFSCVPLIINYLVGMILYVLIMAGGTILLIVPGIIWMIKFQFFTYLIVDRKLGPVKALKKSGEITKGAKWDLFVFGLLLLVINIVGLCCLGIGLFATIPATMIAVAYVYRSLLKNAEAGGVAEKPQPEVAEKELSSEEPPSDNK